MALVQATANYSASLDLSRVELWGVIVGALEAVRKVVWWYWRAVFGDALSIRLGTRDGSLGS